MGDVGLSVCWLLTWESEYGDEGEGREIVGVFDHHDDAAHAQYTLERPAGFSPRGTYELQKVPRNPGIASEPLARSSEHTPRGRSGRSLERS